MLIPSRGVARSLLYSHSYSAKQMSFYGLECHKYLAIFNVSEPHRSRCQADAICYAKRWKYSGYPRNTRQYATEVAEMVTISREFVDPTGSLHNYSTAVVSMVKREQHFAL